MNKLQDQQENAVRLGDLLSGIIQKKNWQHRLNLHSIFDFWDEAVGPDISVEAQPLYIRRTVLWVEVSDPIWMQQLHLQKILLLDVINRQLSQDKISDIKFLLNTNLSPPRIDTSPPKFEQHEVDEKRLKEFKGLLESVRDEETKTSLLHLWEKYQRSR